MRVLVVEDERKVARALREGLEAEHYDVRVASSGEEGFFLVNNELFDCVVLDLVTRKVARAGQAIELTVKEFEILEYLLRHVGRVVSREMLTRDVWHVAARATPLDNVIDVSIARLRRKIDDSFPVKLLQTVRGVGFVLRRERE